MLFPEWTQSRARCGSGRRLMIRVAEGGRILEERKTTGVGVFACMPGGDDGRTLFASVAPSLHEAEASANHPASILMTKVDVPHAGVPWRR
jgi:hypothetical protein